MRTNRYINSCPALNWRADLFGYLFPIKAQGMDQHVRCPPQDSFCVRSSASALCSSRYALCPCMSALSSRISRRRTKVSVFVFPMPVFLPRAYAAAPPQDRRSAGAARPGAPAGSRSQGTGRCYDSKMSSGSLILRGCSRTRDRSRCNPSTIRSTPLRTRCPRSG